ncbi:glycosyltransferase [Paenibacillus sp. 481]|uniref:glycosyltransferase n=1 Tax=Paenibacillus sp. 481 TaxID=2835869 RepID=UPI001E4A0E11|nr:glycosyltransferase [Paenibacillus sp. 481]UHA74493.1 glycosyltransferase [Paenibacillus sp. 481]
MFPLVSIIIPFYNDPFIEQALSSAVQQNYPNIEIVVVDDGSTMHVDKMAPYRDRIHYLGKANGGTASALNHGIKHSAGQYVVWLSSDDLFYPHKITNQLHHMLERNALISHTNFDYINAFGQVTQQRAALLFNSAVDFYQGFFKYNPINGCTVMMRRDLFYHVGYFNEALPYTHDLDFWYRIMLAGFEVHFVNEPLTAYRWHSAMGTMRYRPAINEELKETNRHYHPLMRDFIARLGR